MTKRPDLSWIKFIFFKGVDPCTIGLNGFPAISAILVALFHFNSFKFASSGVLLIDNRYYFEQPGKLVKQELQCKITLGTQPQSDSVTTPTVFSDRSIDRCCPIVSHFSYLLDSFIRDSVLIQKPPRMPNRLDTSIFFFLSLIGLCNHEPLEDTTVVSSSFYH